MDAGEHRLPRRQAAAAGGSSCRRKSDNGAPRSMPVAPRADQRKHAIADYIRITGCAVGSSGCLANPVRLDDN